MKKPGPQEWVWWFPGFALPGAPAGQRFAFFAVPFDLESADSIRLETEDAVGNRAAVSFVDRLQLRPYDQDVIELSTGFMEKVVPEILANYQTKDFLWVQEEPWNMGGWSFVRDRLKRVLPRGARLRYVGRPEASSPAPGSYRQHEAEEAEFVADAFARRARSRREEP